MSEELDKERRKKREWDRGYLQAEGATKRGDRLGIYYLKYRVWGSSFIHTQFKGRIMLKNSELFIPFQLHDGIKRERESTTLKGKGRLNINACFSHAMLLVKKCTGSRNKEVLVVHEGRGNLRIFNAIKASTKYRKINRISFLR